MTRFAEIFPPGEFLKEELEARNWSQTEFAEIIGRPVRLINEIIAAKKSITPETAVQLAASLGTSAELWLNLENAFQLSKVSSSSDAIARRGQLHSRYPVREMIKRGWLQASEDISVLESCVKQFYQLDTLDDTPCLAHAARKTSYKDVSILQWTWLFRVKQIAEAYVVKKYRRDRLEEALNRIKLCLSAPEEIRHVPKLLTEAGVRFVIVEALPGTKIDGACLWLSNDQPVIAMSTRLDRIDNFWFVIRHEIEHLIREHGKDELMMVDEDLCSGKLGGREPREEKIANAAAAQFAVSDAELSDYMARVNPYFFSEEKILGFAGRLSVHPGIVVGRLQKTLEGLGSEAPYRFMRKHLVKVRHIVTKCAPTDGWGSTYSVK